MPKIRVLRTCEHTQFQQGFVNVKFMFLSYFGIFYKWIHNIHLDKFAGSENPNFWHALLIWSYFKHIQISGLDKKSRLDNCLWDTNSVCWYILILYIFIETTLARKPQNNFVFTFEIKAFNFTNILSST